MSEGSLPTEQRTQTWSLRWVPPPPRLSAWRQFLNCREERGTHTEPGNLAALRGDRNQNSGRMGTWEQLERNYDIHRKDGTNPEFNNVKSTVSSVRSEVAIRRKKWGHVTHTQEKNELNLSLPTNLEEICIPLPKPTKRQTDDAIDMQVTM